MTSFAIIGLGEVGAIFARDLHQAGAGAITGYDISAEASLRAEATGHVRICASARDAVAGAEMVFVTVTAGSDIAAMTSLAGGLAHGPFVIDANSVSPGTKREAARIVGEMGGRYVEAAVMTSIAARGLGSPMLLGGPHARAFAVAMEPFAMRLDLFGEEIGGASSVKMCRSIMIKGLEALATECMLAARSYGVERQVLASLADTLAHPDWAGLARYVISRALIHGRRRAEEMREAARTVHEAGFTPIMSEAIADKQQWAAEQGQRLSLEELATQELGPLLDRLLALSRQAPATGRE
ncbi:3-hydroxyisobutyrate dehydrogenase [Rhizobiales bacterium GAS113]|nr:3-hydroxyisobutyrate dehydrogenase [Rhizobiales bacterium GAS113]